MTISSILLIPTDEALLAERPCGARAPMAWKNLDGVWLPGGYGTITNQPVALVLAWANEPVVEGMDRAVRSLGYSSKWNPDTVSALVRLLRRTVNFGSAGTLILLNHEGNEVSP